jgi:hypothetical protein
MQRCKSCERVRFFSINFIFSKSICNECYMTIKEKKREHVTKRMAAPESNKAENS